MYRRKECKAVKKTKSMIPSNILVVAVVVVVHIDDAAAADDDDLRFQAVLRCGMVCCPEPNKDIPYCPILSRKDSWPAGCV